MTTGSQCYQVSNFTFDQAAGSHSLAAAGQRERPHVTSPLSRTKSSIPGELR
jgi:hypothetical protein